MAWRVIVRFSLNSDQGSVVRNTIAGILNANGITNTATGTWESAALADVQAANTLAQITTQLAASPTLNPGAHLDHLWIYVDRV